MLQGQVHALGHGHALGQGHELAQGQDVQVYILGGKVQGRSVVLPRLEKLYMYVVK